MSRPTGSEALLIPVKDFSTAKSRLAPALGPNARKALAKRLAVGVLSAISKELKPVIVSDAPATTQWALGEGLHVLSCKANGGLSSSLDEARSLLDAGGYSRITILHSDLPFLTSFGGLDGTLPEGVAAITPDRKSTGTNMLSLPIQIFQSRYFKFSYGEGSFESFVRQFNAMPVAHVIHRDPAIEFDLDTPEDLLDFREAKEQNASFTVANQ